MISYKKNFVYIYFFCPVDFRKKQWVRNTSWIFRLMFGFVGPYTHVCISYGMTLNQKSMMNTTITLGTKKPVTYRRTMDDIPGYSCWAIPATIEQQTHMMTIAEEIEKIEGCYISKIKLYGLDRVIPCLYDKSITNEYQPDWMCSELTMFLLSKSGVIKADKNPRLYTPTAIFKELAMKNIGEDINNCSYNYKKFNE